MQTVELSPDYYRDNFHFLLDWIEQRYAHLLSDEQARFISQFLSLPKTSQCLAVRFASRKGPWFRVEKISYAEIGCIYSAAETLLDNELLFEDPALTLDELGQILTKKELHQLFQLPGYSTLNKDGYLSQIHNQIENLDTKKWSDWTSRNFGALFFWPYQELIQELQLLFFGNSYQKLTKFVLLDLGLHRYEQYSIDSQHQLFKTQQEVLSYRRIDRWNELLDNRNDLYVHLELANELHQFSVPASIQRRFDKLRNRVGYEIERRGYHEIALSLYQTNQQPPSRERQIRLLEKQGDITTAWQLISKVLEAPHNEEELQIIKRIAVRLSKKLQQPFITTPRFSPQEMYFQMNELTASLNENSIELCVQQHLTRDNAPCYYVENILFTSLFGLWIWPDMFRAIDGAFANPFQAAPLDMYHPEFAQKRDGLCERWQELEQSDFSVRILKRWHEKMGMLNHWVSWDLDVNIIENALNLIPIAHLTLIFERLLFDPKNNRSGFPDLIQFFPESKTYELIEVKGPGDRLQDNQIRWFTYFDQHAIPAKVCYVIQD